MGRNQRDQNLNITDEIVIDAGVFQSNGTEVVTISNLAPSGVGTATIALWLKVTRGGLVYYIPAWT